MQDILGWLWDFTGVILAVVVVVEIQAPLCQNRYIGVEVASFFQVQESAFVVVFLVYLVPPELRRRYEKQNDKKKYAASVDCFAGVPCVLERKHQDDKERQKEEREVPFPELEVSAV